MLKTLPFIFYTFFLASPAFAEPGLMLDAFTLQGKYRFTWNDIPIGKMFINARESGGTYRIQTDMETSGVLKLFTNQKSTSIVEGRGLFDPENTSRTFTAQYLQEGKTPSHIKLVYVAGALKEKVVEPPDPPGKRGTVVPEQVFNSLDFLTFVPAVRQKLFNALQSNQQTFEVKLFDGKRLMQTFWTVKGRTTIAYGAGEKEVILCTAHREPLAGFTAKEEARITDGEPVLQVWFSDDEKLLPLRLSVDVVLGALTGELQQTL